jgi:hypothetical protein
LTAVHNRIGRFGEEERWLTIGIVAHFASMGGVVSSDAEDATDRKAIIGPGNRHTWAFGASDHESGHF